MKTRTKATAREALLALVLVRGIGGKTLARIALRHELLGQSGDELMQISSEALRESFRVPKKTADEWVARRSELLGTSKALLERLDSLDVNFVTPVDAHYPTTLTEFEPDPPGLLFLHGNSKLLESQTFGVLSSRKSSRAALDCIERLCEEGVLNGEVLVAGHDTPEYQRAAVVPLRWGAPRILVLDRGFFRVMGDDLSDEPFRSARLWRYKFDPHTDLAISTVNPIYDSNRGANRQRDRLVGALAKRLDFVQVSEGGNMEALLHRACATRRAARIWDMNPQYRSYLAAGAVAISAK